MEDWRLETEDWKVGRLKNYDWKIDDRKIGRWEIYYWGTGD